MPISPATINLIVIIAGIVVVVWIVSQMMGVSIGELWLGTRATARTRVDEEPRDQAERWTSNHRKMSRETRPRICKFMALAGDADVPPKRVGRISGIEAHQEVYLVYAKSRRIGWSRPFVIPRELVSDLNRRTVVVQARTFTTNGIYRVAVPMTGSTLKPDIAMSRADQFFASSFGSQALVDAREDTVWAMSTALMPKAETRIKVAEVQAPRFVERRAPGISEERT